MSGNEAHHASHVTSTLSQHQHHDTDIPGTPDRVKFQAETTTYSNSGHWTSILDGVSFLLLAKLPFPEQNLDLRVA